MGNISIVSKHQTSRFFITVFDGFYALPMRLWIQIRDFKILSCIKSLIYCSEKKVHISLVILNANDYHY